jgi:hypothetical protein
MTEALLSTLCVYHVTGIASLGIHRGTDIIKLNADLVWDNHEFE